MGNLEPVEDDLGQRFPSGEEETEQNCSLGKEPGRKLFPPGEEAGQNCLHGEAYSFLVAATGHLTKAVFKKDRFILAHKLRLQANMVGTQDTNAGDRWSYRIHSRKADTDGQMLVLTGFLLFIQAMKLYHPHLIHIYIMNLYNPSQTCSEACQTDH